jgi:hypothetical protein
MFDDLMRVRDFLKGHNICLSICSVSDFSHPTIHVVISYRKCRHAKSQDRFKVIVQSHGQHSAFPSGYTRQKKPGEHRPVDGV